MPADRQSVAHILGMKVNEVVDLIPVPEGTVAVTHDGIQSLLDPDGRLVGPYRRPSLAEQALASSARDADPDDDPDTLESLRVEAVSLGIKVDKRWKAPRLREEIDAAKSK